MKTSGHSAPKHDILIIGGGLAGLTLAYRLQQAGIDYTLIEARNRLGGRIHTIETASGGTIEMGATWFADKHQHLISLIDELGIGYEPQYFGKRVLYDFPNPDRSVQEVAIPPITEPSYIFSQGTNSLIEALAAKLDPNNLLLGEEVQAMTLAEGTWNITTSKQEFEVGTVINTLPPNLFVKKVKTEPALPEALINVAKSTHTWMGESIKVGVELEARPWRYKEIGTFFSNYGPATELHDHIHEGSEGHALMGFIDGSFRKFDQEARRQMVQRQLQLYFSEQLDAKKYHDLDWLNEQHTYASYDSEVYGHQNNGHPALRESLFDNQLIFSGTETARSYPGYMDGAVERAEEVEKALKVEEEMQNQSV